MPCRFHCHPSNPAMPRLSRSTAGGSGTARGVPSATGTPLSIRQHCPRRPRVCDLGGGVPSVKSSRTELNACPPATEMNDAVSVLLKPNENDELVSMVPPSVPFAMASTATVGLGSPGNNQTGCVPHDRVPRLPRVAVPSGNRTCISGWCSGTT